MNESIQNIGDAIYSVLAFCYSDENRASLEAVAREHKATFEQIVSAAVSQMLCEKFLIIPKELPGIPKAGRPIEILRAIGRPHISDERFKLFVSYRHADSKAYTERIFDHLTVEFGANLIFKDTISMPLGHDFRSVVRSVLRKCALILVIVGPGWTGASNADGSKRLFDADDPIRIEVETALESNIPIIPVLVDRATRPELADLPPSIRAINGLHHISIRSDPDFTSDMSCLIDECRNQTSKTNPFAPLPIPRLPTDARLPVRVLAASAFYVRAALLAIANGRKLEDFRHETGDLLPKCDRVIDLWCHHYGIPENDDLPNPSIP